MDNQASIPVVVNGAAGKMGREVIKAVSEAEGMHLVGAIDKNPNVLGQDAGEVAGCGPVEIPILADAEATLASATQEEVQGVVVDFTHPDCVYENVRSAIAYGVRPVVGTSGLSAEQIDELAAFADKASTGCLVVPNFSIGVLLLQEAVVKASKYFDHVEIIELHHNQKADAPSGTAVKTAQMLAETGKIFNPAQVEETEKMAGARGCTGAENVNIHSVRLPGFLAHQEVIFGSPGQLYTLRHDSTDRASFMPGVILAIRAVTQLKSLVYGLEKVLD
ncbi:MAG: 4-hydroxy-tetrahydrodipicolinate reductase [Merismopedia sp. SIO2A8]|nr:4-hydroxy-tetrahydrodipicolinate reductase [Symploca sp. SIO2B6]NET49680.1 4-hydroxy-tetrahydrodipicolinate reductase [Merismopedia sp. SIO2A8]